MKLCVTGQQFLNQDTSNGPIYRMPWLMTLMGMKFGKVVAASATLHCCCFNATWSLFPKYSGNFLLSMEKPAGSWKLIRIANAPWQLPGGCHWLTFMHPLKSTWHLLHTTRYSHAFPNLHGLLCTLMHTSWSTLCSHAVSPTCLAPPMHLVSSHKRPHVSQGVGPPCELGRVHENARGYMRGGTQVGKCGWGFTRAVQVKEIAQGCGSGWGRCGDTWGCLRLTTWLGRMYKW